MADLEDLFAHHHLLDAVIEEVDGRRIRVGELLAVLDRLVDVVPLRRS